jgi:hypothetical protein
MAFCGICRKLKQACAEACAVRAAQKQVAEWVDDVIVVALNQNKNVRALVVGKSMTEIIGRDLNSRHCCIKCLLTHYGSQSSR